MRKCLLNVSHFLIILELKWENKQQEFGDALLVQGKSGSCLRVLRLINKGIKGAQTNTYKQTSKEQDQEAIKLSSNLGG